MEAVSYGAKLPRKYSRGQSRGRPLAGFVIGRDVVPQFDDRYVPARDLGEPAKRRNVAQADGPDVAGAFRNIPIDRWCGRPGKQPSAGQRALRPDDASSFTYSIEHRFDRGALPAAAQLTVD